MRRLLDAASTRRRPWLRVRRWHGDDADPSDYVEPESIQGRRPLQAAREADGEIVVSASIALAAILTNVRRRRTRGSRYPAVVRQSLPTDLQTQNRDALRPPTAATAVKWRCPALELLRGLAATSGDKLDTGPRDLARAAKRELARATAMCGTDRKLDNCSNDEAQGADIYRIVGSTPNYQPTKPPTDGGGACASTNVVRRRLQSERLRVRCPEGEARLARAAKRRTRTASGRRSRVPGDVDVPVSHSHKCHATTLDHRVPPASRVSGSEMRNTGPSRTTNGVKPR